MKVYTKKDAFDLGINFSFLITLQQQILLY